MWDKVFKNRPIKICGRQSLKILIGPFLNTLSHLTLTEILKKSMCVKNVQKIGRDYLDIKRYC